MAEELAQGMAAAAVSNWEPMEFNDARKASVKAAFELAASEGKLSMKEVHKLLFTAEERSEYNFDNFQEVSARRDSSRRGGAESGSWQGKERELGEVLRLQSGVGLWYRKCDVANGAKWFLTEILPSFASPS
mmetsp:Transcript_30893/g.75095  ORF Transcript_30893/g.75095 Transcript_30893/m.75095 type:complete len:132 (-) Transcript_30893:298-693(-)